MFNLKELNPNAFAQWTEAEKEAFKALIVYMPVDVEAAQAALRMTRPPITAYRVIFDGEAFGVVGQYDIRPRVWTPEHVLTATGLHRSYTNRFNAALMEILCTLRERKKALAA